MHIYIDFSKLNLNYLFESEGDCRYSAPITLSRDQLLIGQVNIKCRVNFKTTKVGLLKRFRLNEQKNCACNGPRKVTEIGNITPEVWDCEPSEMRTVGDGLMAFMQV